MLENAIADFVTDLSERELDAPFRALLRAEGFHDIAFVHGVSEFGRDFIAKREDGGVLKQYSFQCKAGDLNLSAWRDVRQQLDDIRTISIAHPYFDSELQGVIVLVNTGSLRGDARGAAEGYRDSLQAPWTFETWTEEKLVLLFRKHLSTALGGRASGPLLSLLGAVDVGHVDLVELERHSRRWIPEDGSDVSPVDIMEAALVANRLRESDRLDLACYCAIGIVRAQLTSVSAELPVAEQDQTNIDSAGEFFAVYANELWSLCSEEALDPRKLIDANPEFGFWVTYPVRCLRLIEILGLLGLWKVRRGEDTDDIAAFLRSFVERQPGCSHPISDRHALSLVAPALMIADRGEVVDSWLRKVVTWTADRYEGESLGLAGTDADPAEEVDYLLGDLESVDRSSRSVSFLASVLLDLFSVLQMPDLYAFARNEFLATEVVLDLRCPPAGREAWLRDGDGLIQELNPPYAETFHENEGWETAPHLRQTEVVPWATQAGLEWEALASWGILRDRFVALEVLSLRAS